jgi:polysaccharide pyruvyl transferase CsaB
MRVLLSGYFGFNNLGDEAIFEAMVASLRAQRSDIQLEALTANPARAERLGVRAIPRKSLGPVTAAIRRCDLLISGGGGLVQDSTGVGSVAYYLGLCQLARFLGKPTMFYAQGFGPVKSSMGQRLCRLMSKSLSLITLRDDESWKDMSALGFGSQKAYITADPALLLEPPPVSEFRQLLEKHGLSQELSRLEGPMGRFQGSGPLVAVTVRPWPGLPEDQLFAALKRFQDEQKARYLILPFHPHQDLAISQRLKDCLGGPGQIVGEDWSPAQITGLLRCCDMVVGMRLHSLILAAGAYVPSIGLCYDPKVTRFVRRAGALPIQLADITADGLARDLERMLEGRNAAREQMRQRVDLMKGRAQLTAQAAVELAEHWRSPDLAQRLESLLGVNPGS